MPENKNTLSAPLSTTGSLSGRITVGSVEYYDKHTLDQLLVGKADVEHSHDDKYITKDTYSYNLNVWSMNLTELKNTDAEIKTSLEGKADTNHTHSYNDLTDLPDLEDIGIDTSNLATKEELNGKAEKNHTHDITWDGGETVDLQTAFDYVAYYKANKNHTHDQYLTEHQDISGKADITYVNNAINTALNGIESKLDEIIGEEV